jgi:hypothetical protein
MSEEQNQFRFSRRLLVKAYTEMAAKTGQNFIATTKPVHSVQSMRGEVINPSVALGYGYLVFRRGQQMVFFEPALGSSGQLSADPSHRWSEADTTLTKARSTPGAADMAIEGIGMHLRGVKTEMAAATGFFPAAQAADAALLAAFAGTGAIFDPGSHVVPAEVSSPAMLEEVLYTALAPFLTLSFEWDQAERTEKIGTADQVGVGGGSSYLRANGVPSPRDRFNINEGYLWTRDGQPGCEFICRATLANDVLIPITLPVPPEANTTWVAPIAIHAEFICRLFGVQFRLPNKN